LTLAAEVIEKATEGPRHHRHHQQQQQQYDWQAVMDARRQSVSAVARSSDDDFHSELDSM